MNIFINFTIQPKLRPARLSNYTDALEAASQFAARILDHMQKHTKLAQKNIKNLINATSQQTNKKQLPTPF